jgi:hypothetical protein
MNKGSLKIQSLRVDAEKDVEYKLSVTNNDSSTTIEFWGTLDMFKEFADKLKTFPNSSKEDVVFEIGAEDKIDQKLKSAYHIFIRAYCFDQAAHTALEIMINNHASNPETKLAKFNIYSEAEQINDLGRKLFQWDPATASEFIWESSAESR